MALELNNSMSQIPEGGDSRDEFWSQFVGKSIVPDTLSLRYSRASESQPPVSLGSSSPLRSSRINRGFTNQMKVLHRIHKLAQTDEVKMP